MTITQGLALAIIVVATLDAMHMATAMHNGYLQALSRATGTRTRRLMIRRMGKVVIRYQAAIGVTCLLLGVGTSALALLGSSALWWMGLHLWDRDLSAPWWAPGAP